MKGRLKDRPLAKICRELAARSATGVLTLERGPVKKQICLVQGALRFAASNVRDDRLGEFLVRTSTLPEEDVRKAEQEAAGARKLSQALAASGVLPAEDLHRALHAHTVDVVLPCFDWKDGQYQFQAGMPNLVGEVLSEVSVLELAVAHTRLRLTPEQVQKALSDRSRTLVLAANPGKELSSLELSQPEAYILAQAGTGEPFSAILLRPLGDRAELERAAAVLVETGVLSFSKASAQPGVDVYDTLPPGMKAPARPFSEPAAAVPEGGTGRPAEVLYYKQMYELLLGADYYTILGLDSNVKRDEVQQAYYRRAKEIHPDRFLAPPLDVLHAEMEELFSQVLEAYKTLIDPETRKGYDAERLSGGTAPKQAEAEQQAIGRGNFLRGRTLYEEGKLADALTYLQNAVDAEPNRPEYRRLLATVQGSNPRLRREAVKHYAKAIELDPARAETYLQLGLLYGKLGETDKAIETLRECIKWDPTNVEAGTALFEMTRVAGSRP